MSQQPSNESEASIFEGSNHVLRGIQQQLDFWNAVEGHAAEKREMLPGLTAAAEALRGALQRARGGTAL
jgi:hypothetical protein